MSFVYPPQLLRQSHRGGHRSTSVEKSRPYPGAAGGCIGREVLREDSPALRLHAGIRGEGRWSAVHQGAGGGGGTYDHYSVEILLYK